MENFRKLGIQEEVLKTLQELKFEKPSEIQEKAIPLVLAGKDVIAGASTGSGKTLAFGAGIIQKVQEGKGIQALVLTPTRELAQQVKDSLVRFSKYKKLRFCTVYGGVAMGPQVENLEYSDVVIGTPGRILDHLQRGTLKLQGVNILVLDEADRMLDMGFIDDVEKIIQKCNAFRQTLLFSATIPPEVRSISKRYMQNPTEVFAEANVDPSKLKQVYYDVDNNQKLALLLHLLKNDKSELVMVFCNTQRNTDFVAENLKYNGINALAIHGGYSQNKRSRTMEKFHSRDFHVLVCTDVAARGLDIKGVTHVYNYDAPNESSQYVHRIGRTARAGAEGIAINIISERDYENFGKVKREHPEIERVEAPEVEKVAIGFKHQSNRRNFSRRSDDRGERSDRGEGRGFRDRGASRGRFSGHRGGGRNFSRSRSNRGFRRF